MNWVGGSRNRLVMRNDAKKQREFFEKRKIQQRLKHLGVSPPVPCSGDTFSGSTDLMTLFIVNQIATKKANQDPPKVAVLGSKGGSKHRRNQPLVLPMSPCSPSQLSLAESPSQCSAQGNRKRKNALPQIFSRCQQLSPVLESAFSDNSASDYLPHGTHPPSPSSSPSSASSRQGIFPRQMRLNQTQMQTLPHFSPPPWDASLQTTFQPFSQPRGMTDAWTCRPSEPLFHLETPTAAQLLFGSPNPDCQTKGRRHGRHAATFLSQPEDGGPAVDLTLNQAETQQLFEDDASGGFGDEDERGVSASHFGKSKIYLTDEASVRSSALQTVPDPQSMGAEPSSCTDMNSPLNAWEYSPGCCCRAGYLSSDSQDEEGCEMCLPAHISHMDHACCADLLHINSQRSPKLFRPRPLAPQTKSQMIFGDDQEVMDNFACPEKAFQSSIAPSPSPHLPTQRPESCKCNKLSTETRDAGTQTAYSCTPETRDASAQCSFDANTEASGFSSDQPDVGVSGRLPATRGQSRAEPPTLTASLKNRRGEEKPTAWTAKAVHKFLQRPKDSFLDVLSIRGNENVEGGDGRQHENRPLMEVTSGVNRPLMEVTSGVNRPLMEVTSGVNRPLMEVTSRVNRPLMEVTSGVNALSEEVETLKEIADILLMLKQRRQEE